MKWLIRFKPLRFMFNTNLGKPSRFYRWTMEADMWTEDLMTFPNLRELIFKIHQHSVHTRQNIAAMRIRILKSMESCMIKAKSLDSTLEVEAISSATHILSRSPHNALDGKIPFEAWCGRKVVVSHFRFFSCPGSANLSPRGCKALAPRLDGVKAYRFMDLETLRFLWRRMFTLRKVQPTYRLILSTLRTLWKLIVTPVIVLQHIQIRGVLSIVVAKGHGINIVHMLILPQ